MNATSQDTTTPQRPNAPFGRLGLVKRPVAQDRDGIMDAIERCRVPLSESCALLSPATS
jgi:hypothetical protein